MLTIKCQFKQVCLPMSVKYSSYVIVYWHLTSQNKSLRYGNVAAGMQIKSLTNSTTTVKLLILAPVLVHTVLVHMLVFRGLVHCTANSVNEKYLIF